MVHLAGPVQAFSENDRQLGGPLLDDDTVLFTAQQDTRHYWRVESKDFYSGKGLDQHDTRRRSANSA